MLPRRRKSGAYIQRSKKPVAELAIELGVSETTIYRWRGRTTVTDRSHTPKRLTTKLSSLEEALICELRTQLQLPLDDISEVMRRCVNPKISRSATHRCLKRHGLNKRPTPGKPPVGVFEQATVGFIHIDLKHLPALVRRKSYAFCRHRSGDPLRLARDPSQAGCQHLRLIPQTLPPALSTSGSYHPHRQWQ